MGNSGSSRGQTLAVFGAAGVAASLWLPWYTIQLPPAALSSADAMAKQLGALGPLITSGARLLSQLGPFHITAWQAFNTTPAVLLVAAIIGGGLALLALADRAGNSPQLTILAGIVAALLAGYRIAVPPGQGSFVHPAWGAYLALVSAFVMVAGGVLSGSDGDAYVPIPVTPAAEWPPAAAPAAAPANWSTAGTVPPPRP